MKLHSSTFRSASRVTSLIDRGPVTLRQKRVDFVASRGQREGVRSLFGCDSSKRLHRFRVEYIYGAGVAYCDIEAFVHAIEKHDIRRAAQGVPSQDLPGPRIERDQFPRVAGAEQALRVGIKIEPVRANRGDREYARDALRLRCVDYDDLGGISDVHIKRPRLMIKDCPPGAAGHWDLGSYCPFIDCDDGERVRARYGRISDVGNEELSMDMIIGEAIGADTDSYLRHLRVRARTKDADCVLRPVGTDDELR